MASAALEQPLASSGIGALPGPYLLFLGDVVESGYAKTAFGLRDWAPERCIAEWSLPQAGVSTGLPRLDPKQAAAAGARALVIGVASPGGSIPPSWLDDLEAALDAGLDLIAGMHHRLADLPRLASRAARLGRTLHDLRVPPAHIPVGSGAKRPGKRLLTVGTDCALGKKYTALALARSFATRGLDVDFRATGQTGILIAGAGVPIDAVVADFIAGAAELVSPTADPDHWDVIEGQGSLFHPSYAGVSLGLLHGSQPDRFVVCHDPLRAGILGHEEMPLPAIETIVAQTIALGRLTNPAIACAGVSLNTGALDSAGATAAIEATAARLGMATADPMRGGDAWERLVDACLA